MSAEGGLPLVDVHGLTFSDAGEAAAQAVAAVVADPRARAEAVPANDKRPLEIPGPRTGTAI